MTLTIRHYDVEITVKHDRDDLTFSSFVEEVIYPACLALGYSPETVDAGLCQNGVCGLEAERMAPRG